MRAATPVTKFGKDHWSLMAYAENCCVNGRNGIGSIDRRRVRCNPAAHPMLGGAYSASVSWKLSYSTRLFGFFDFDGRNDPEAAISAGLQLRDHDDWNCLDDLESAGYVEVLSQVNGLVKMTDRGCAVAGALRAHKARGGQFAEFQLHAEPCVA